MKIKKNEIESPVEEWQYIIDEIYSFVERKENKKRWFNLLNNATRKVHKFVFWGRDIETMDSFFYNHIGVEETKKITTLRCDNRDSFLTIARKIWLETLVWKERTRRLERFHLTVRTMLARFVRRWIRYSKNIIRHEKIYWLFIRHYNATL